MNEYSMDETLNIAKQASYDIELFLNNQENTIKVLNVEDKPEYQKKDIDLLYFYKYNEKKKFMKIEIKGDRYYNTGNYFFETISNKELETKGCFLYTESDYIFYYFVDAKELHILHTEKTRKWFLENQNMFKIKECHTSVENQYYTTVGCLVNRRYLLKNIPVKIIKINLKKS